MSQQQIGWSQESILLSRVSKELERMAGLIANSSSAINLTTTGSSGSATYIGGVLNIPTYTLAGLGGQPLLGYIPENSANKQNSMAIGGAGVKFPTVDAVNAQANTLAKAVLNIGLIDVVNDTFNMVRADDTHLNITGTSQGIIFPSYFNTPPFAPSDAVKQMATNTSYPLQNFLSYLATNTQAVFYIGYRHTTAGFELSNTSYVQNQNVFQCGVIFLKNVAGIISFIDINRTIIVMPDVSAYFNLATTGISATSSVIMSPITGTMTIRNSAGSLVGISVNYKGTNNDEKAIASNAVTTFIRLNPSNANAVTLPSFGTTVVTNDYYNGTAMVTVPSGSNATVQRWLLSVRGTFILQPGEIVYANLGDAQSAVSIATFTDFLPKGTFVEIARMVATRNATDLGNNTQAVFFTTGRGGGGSGSSSATIWGAINGNLVDQLDLNTVLTSLALEQITITTAISISTETTDVSGNIQGNRFVVIDNGINNINYTINGTVNKPRTFAKLGTGTITFVQGPGRTLVLLTGISVLNGIVGSTAGLYSVGLTDFLAITNY